MAQLQLPVSAPGIGPDPDVNEWKMAAIGYPLWLWADGPTHVGPVGQNVAGLSVSLDAQLSKTVFRMGDGKSVTCAGGGKPYASWVQPGAKSPTCGYVYEKPSLPSKKYKRHRHDLLGRHVDGERGQRSHPGAAPRHRRPARGRAPGRHRSLNPPPR